MTKHTPLKSLFSLALMLAFTSCDDDEPNVARLTSTQFIQDKLTFSEHETSSEISILLNQAAPKDGVITISVTTDNINSFITTPAIVDGKIELPITAGQGDVTFSFAPIDNAILNETQSVDFMIGSVSEGFSVGAKKILSIAIVDNESPALAGFQQELGSILENSTSTTTVTIALSHASPGSGSIEVSLDADNATYGINYVTEPAAANGKIILPVAAGVDHVEFKAIPVNDQLYNEERIINYTISKTEGSVILGQTITNTLKITDDEILGHTKGYTTGGANGWGYKREYKYDEQGKISKIVWEQSAPGNHLAGTYIYQYDESGNVVKMIETLDLTETNYTWENGRIIKEESFRDGLLKKYVLYGYDNAGNVGESSFYYRQPNGDLELGLLIVYLYRLDGNIYKQITYSPIEGSDDYNLISTKTWEYSTKENPFSMVEILPNQHTQPNLPISYRLEEGGHDFLFQFTYQFNSAGKPTKRTATSSTGSETTNYQYY